MDNKKRAQSLTKVMRRYTEYSGTRNINGQANHWEDVEKSIEEALTEGAKVTVVVEGSTPKLIISYDPPKQEGKADGT